MSANANIASSDEILSGTPTFEGTRVPIQTLFDYLAAGDTIDAFLEDFPTVSKEKVVSVLKLIGKNVPTLVA